MHDMNGYSMGGPVRLSADALPLIRVTGEGRVEAVPDTAEVSLGFSVRTEQASAAYQETATVLNRVVQTLLEMGIPREQLQTQQIGLQPIYEKERLVGYEGSATLRVTLKDLAAVGAAIDRAVAAGATNVHGVSFVVRDPSLYEANALSLAMQDAQRKAMLLARSAGVGLSQVWRVEAESAPGPVIGALARVAPLESIPVLPGTLSVTRRVQAEFVIQYG